jgi:hypothetical protein
VLALPSDFCRELLTDHQATAAAGGSLVELRPSDPDRKVAMVQDGMIHGGSAFLDDVASIQRR